MRTSNFKASPSTLQYCAIAGEVTYVGGAQRKYTARCADRVVSIYEELLVGERLVAAARTDSLAWAVPDSVDLLVAYDAVQGLDVEVEQNIEVNEYAAGAPVSYYVEKSPMLRRFLVCLRELYNDMLDFPRNLGLLIPHGTYKDWEAGAVSGYYVSVVLLPGTTMPKLLISAATPDGVESPMLVTLTSGRKLRIDLPGAAQPALQLLQRIVTTGAWIQHPKSDDVFYVVQVPENFRKDGTWPNVEFVKFDRYKPAVFADYGVSYPNRRAYVASPPAATYKMHIRQNTVILPTESGAITLTFSGNNVSQHTGPRHHDTTYWATEFEALVLDATPNASGQVQLYKSGATQYGAELDTQNNVLWLDAQTDEKTWRVQVSLADTQFGEVLNIIPREVPYTIHRHADFPNGAWMLAKLSYLAGFRTFVKTAMTDTWQNGLQVQTPVLDFRVSASNNWANTAEAVLSIGLPHGALQDVPTRAFHVPVGYHRKAGPEYTLNCLSERLLELKESRVIVRYCVCRPLDHQHWLPEHMEKLHTLLTENGVTPVHIPWSYLEKNKCSR